MSSPAYPTSVSILGGGMDAGVYWLDISGDVLQSDGITLDWGIPENRPLARTATAGSMTFTLNNAGKRYSPDSGSGRSGWGLGTPIELRVVYDNTRYIRFHGFVSEIRLQGDVNGSKRAYVTALDWMEYATKYPLKTPAIQTSQPGNVAISTIVAGMPVAPLSTSYDTGVNVFPALFDSVSPYTRALSEFAKIAQSELGFVYVRHSGTYGEELVFENNGHRNGQVALTEYPIATGDASAWLMENGDYALDENGDRILLDQVGSFTAAASQTGMDVTYADNLINQVTVTAYPKRIDPTGTPVILYNLPNAMQIGRGQTLTFKGTYSDPVGGARANAISSTMVTPVATTDYLLNTAANGSGTNKTADATVVAVFSTADVEWTITNGSTEICYITKLQARGYGVYVDNPIDGVLEDSASQTLYGVIPLGIPQPYQRDLDFGKRYGEYILDANKKPYTKLNSVSFIGNKSSGFLQAGLNLDVGDKIHITEAQTGIDGDYYIQGVRMHIAAGNIISWAWIVTQALSLVSGLSMLAVEFRGLASADAVDFGNVPAVTSLDQLTVSAWIYPTTPSGEIYQYTILQKNNGNAGWGLVMDQDDKYLGFSHFGSSSANQAYWRSDFNTITLNAWHHVAVTRDISPYTNAPILYIDGVAVTVTETVAPTSAVGADAAIPVSIGNTLTTGAVDYITPFRGQITDARIYTGIKTAAEIAEIYAAGRGVASSGANLLFQAPCVRTSELGTWTDKTLTADDKLIDNLFHAMGTPHGSPISRLLP
jgi:hypothetical protein